MYRKLAVVFAALVISALVAGAPASAGVETDVRARLLGNGTLDIRGGNETDEVLLCAEGDGDWVLDVRTPEGNHVESFSGVRDLRINLLGGDDILDITPCFDDGAAGRANDVVAENHAEPLVRNIVANLGRGSDEAFIAGMVIGGDLTVIGGTGDADFMAVFGSLIKDDLLLRGHRGDDAIAVVDVEVLDRIDVNMSSGANLLLMEFSDFGRTQVIGGSGEDLVLVNDVGLGLLPRFSTANGDDGIVVFDVSAEGRIAFRTGSGSDALLLAVDEFLDFCDGEFCEPCEEGGEPCGPCEEGGEPCEPCGEDGEFCIDGAEKDVDGPDYLLNVNTGADDDAVFMIGDLLAGDLLNGGAGSEDGLYLLGEDLGARITNFENGGEPDPDELDELVLLAIFILDELGFIFD